MKIANAASFLIVGVVGIPVLYLLFTIANKAYWDARVRSMCLEDGGVALYETVDLSAPEYMRVSRDVNGIPFIPSESRANSEHKFYRTTSRDQKRKSGGVIIVKSNYKIVRSSDRRVLSLSTSYSRLGGDFTTLGSPASSFSCIDIPGFRFDAEIQVFNLIEEQ